MAKTRGEYLQSVARKRSQEALRKQRANKQREKEQTEKRRRAKPIIEAHQEKLGHISVGPLFTVSEEFAVGMPVTRHPPRRSVQAALPHTAPASGLDVQALQWIRVFRGFPRVRDELAGYRQEPRPGHAVSLAAAP